jgi:hypothetical protein
VERHLLTSRVVDAIERAGGTVAEAQRHAALALTIRFEIPCTAAAGLSTALRAAGLMLDATSEAALAAVPAGREPVPATASITFEKEWRL